MRRPPSSTLSPYATLFRSDAADPGQLVDVELGLFRLFKGCRRNAVMDAGDDRPVARRVVVEIVCGLDAARARHVLYDDRGVAGQMGWQESREQATERIVDAARPAAAQQADLLAAVEVVLSRERRMTGCGDCGYPRTSRAGETWQP